MVFMLLLLLKLLLLLLFDVLRMEAGACWGGACMGATLGAAEKPNPPVEPPPPVRSAMNCLVKSSAFDAAPARLDDRVLFQSDLIYEENTK